jgi:hypothetical protein
MTIMKTTLLFLTMALLIWTGPVTGQEIDKLVVLPLQDHTEQPTGGIETLKKIVGNYFGRSQRVEMLTETQIQSLLDSKTGSRKSLAQTVAARMDCNGVLVLTLERYSQRVGSNLSVIDPASLAFKFRLYKAPEGKLVCYERFDETQQALSENILDFAQARERGFKWITVEEMAEKAVRDRFDRCQPLKDRSSVR